MATQTATFGGGVGGSSGFGFAVGGGGPIFPSQIPQIPSGANNVGQVLFVDAEHGVDDGNGGSLELPLASIGFALDMCHSGYGDVIVVNPGSYDENVVVDKDYVAIIGGFAGGYARPDIVPSSGVALTVTGQGCVFSHCRFAGATNDCVKQYGNGFAYSDCVFDGDATAAKAGLRLVPSDTDDSLTASEGKVLGCLFRGNANGIIFDTALPAVGVGSTDNSIAGNRFYSNTLDIATADTGGASTYSVQTTIIAGNSFEDKNKATYIDLTTANGGAASAQTGAINGNTFASDTITTTKIKMVGTGFTFSGNVYTVGVADGSSLD